MYLRFTSSYRPTKMRGAKPLSARMRMETKKVYRRGNKVERGKTKHATLWWANKFGACSAGPKGRAVGPSAERQESKSKADCLKQRQGR